MTTRLYESDAYTTSFASMVTGCAPADDALLRRHGLESRADAGRLHAAVLAETLFYPTSGGQPHDTGAIGDAKVVAVLEDGDRLLHIVDRPIAPGKADCRIDWERRFDHMQQHSGQHILSAAFVRAMSGDTESFHLGADYCTIDVAAISISDERLAAVESMANSVVFGDRVLRVEVLPRDVVVKMPIRRVPELLVCRQADDNDPLRAYGVSRGEVVSELRVITIPDCDCTCCGGTHVRRTGEVGLIKILSTERAKGLLRVEFVCGGRALRDYHHRLAALSATSAQFSSAWRELPAIAQRLLGENGALKKELRRRLDSLDGYESAEIHSNADRSGKWAVARKVFVPDDGRDQKALVALAEKTVARGSCVALFALAGDKPAVVFSRSADLQVDLRPVMKQALSRCGGRGGGHPNLVQGGVPAPATEPGRDSAAAVRATLEDLLNFAAAAVQAAP
ncbi:MAG: DHHA1 domain-containing protein [Planctomycetota bacterium]|nr:DHHA1 domain-containing protein [Planctomycetota bacterium]